MSLYLSVCPLVTCCDVTSCYGQHLLPGQHPASDDSTSARYGGRSGGTHPTGMVSCWIKICVLFMNQSSPGSPLTSDERSFRASLHWASLSTMRQRCHSRSIWGCSPYLEWLPWCIKKFITNIWKQYHEQHCRLVTDSECKWLLMLFNHIKYGTDVKLPSIHSMHFYQWNRFVWKYVYSYVIQYVSFVN